MTRIDHFLIAQHAFYFDAIIDQRRLRYVKKEGEEGQTEKKGDITMRVSRVSNISKYGIIR